MGRIPLLSHKIMTGVKTMLCLTMKFGIRGFQPAMRIIHPLPALRDLTPFGAKATAPSAGPQC